jgi:DNA-binding response OmpR family regulator
MPDKKKIVIVEDDKPISNILSLKLRSAGFEPIVAYNGAVGLEEIEKGCDLIILDLMMPVKDGFEVLKELKEKNITTPVIVMSNLSQDEDIDRAKKLGASDYFVKSNIDLKDVVSQVQKWIN